MIDKFDNLFLVFNSGPISFYLCSSKSRSVPNSEEPSENSVTEVTERDDGVIEEVLYESAEDVRKDPKQSELNQSSPNDTPHDDSSHDNPAYDDDDDILQFTTITIYHEIQEEEMIDNVLYEPADNQTIQTGFSFQNCSDMTPDSVGIHDSKVDSPISDTESIYCDIHPQPGHSPARSNVENHDDDAEPEHGKTDLATAEGLRIDVSSENAPEYALVNKGFESD